MVLLNGSTLNPLAKDGAPQIVVLTEKNPHGYQSSTLSMKNKTMYQYSRLLNYKYGQRAWRKGELAKSIHIDSALDSSAHTAYIY